MKKARAACKSRIDPDPLLEGKNEKCGKFEKNKNKKLISSASGNHSLESQKKSNQDGKKCSKL